MSDVAAENCPVSDEERARALREQVKRLHVLDMAYEMMISLVTIGYQKLGLTDQTRELRDFGDARLAIELLRAILEVAEKERGGGELKDVRSTLAQLQLGYAQAVELAGAEAKAPPEPEAAREPEAKAPREPAADAPGEPRIEAPPEPAASTDEAASRPRERRRTTAKRAPTERASARKAASKKATDEQTSSEKSASKRASAKKAAPKQPAPKKPASRKPRGATPRDD
jgi:hypothetical protein